MLEYIGINLLQDKTSIKNILAEVFSQLNVHYFDQYNSWEIEYNDLLNDDSICFSFIENESEFPIILELTRTPKEDTNERELFLAKIISERLQCRTITRYRPNNASIDYPFDSIVFDKGIAFLTDDNNTIWADGIGGTVQILNQIVLNISNFDTRGNIVKLSR